MKTPLQAEGLARRVYPFLGLAIVGLVSLRGFGSIIASPPLLVATALGALLVLAPLVPFEPPSVGRLPSAIPVLLGFGLALYPLWGSGSVVGIAIAFVLEAQFGSSVLHAFPFLLLPLLFLALYYTTVEFAIGAALAVANVIAVALANPGAADSGLGLLAALVLVALGTLVRRVVADLEHSRAAA